MDPVPDFLRDFAFAKLAEPLDATATSVTVDDVSELPTTAELDATYGQFWMTIESPLSHPHTFEIVRVTAVDPATKTLTLARGERSSTSSHTAGTYIKATISAAMLRKIANGLGGSTLPPGPVTSSGLYAEGQLYYHSGEHQWYFLSDVPGAVWTVLGSGGGGGAIPDFTVAVQWPSTSDLNIIDSATGNPVTGPLSAGLYTVTPKGKALTPPGPVEDLFIMSPAGLNNQLGSNSTAFFSPVASVRISGLNEGDRVDITYNYVPYTMYADASGVLWPDLPGELYLARTGTSMSLSFDLRLVTASTAVIVEEVDLYATMINGTPTNTPVTPVHPDDNETAATVIALNATETWSPDDYTSMDQAGGFAGGAACLNARWFQFTPSADAHVQIAAENDTDVPMRIKVWNGSLSGAQDEYADDTTPWPSATHAGSAMVDMLVTAGTNYWIAVGTKDLNPPLGTQTSFTVNEVVVPAEVLGTEVINSVDGGSLAASLTVPAGTNQVLVYLGYRTTGNLPVFSYLRIGGQLCARDSANDQHDTGSNGYGLAVYTTPVDAVTAGVQTIESGGGLTLTGGIAVYLKGSVNFTSLAAVASGQGGASTGLATGDIALCAVNVNATPTVTTGSLLASAVALIVMEGSDTLATWTGFANGTQGATYVSHP